MSDQPRVTLTIDGTSITVPKGTTVYQAAKRSGIEIPIFCYHDRMPPLGACRMCLVKVEKMAKLQTSCTLEALEGMVVDTSTADVKAGQEAILEFLLINHPLDCPICDKGGECPLQDQTFKFGPGRSRFVEAKRDFAKPVSLGPVLVLDRERCILCWRCVRFGEIVAGDDALKGFERGFHSEINTPFTLPVRSKFIGNTIEICPVGALTAKSYRFIARPWDNTPVKSTCTLCGVGCAVEFDVRGGKIARTRPSEDPAVNDIWLCDLGFFGHTFVHHEGRLRRPLIKREGGFVETTWDDALALIASRLERAGARVAMLGGARLTNEDAYVATRFFRSVVRTAHMDHRVDALARSPDLSMSWGMTTAIEELARADCLLLVGCDITETYPVIWLRMKQSVERGATLIAVGTRVLEIEASVRLPFLHRQAHGAEIVRALGGSVRGSPPGGPVEGIDRDAIAAAAATLSAASQPVVLVGREAMDAPDGWGILLATGEICRTIGVDLNVMRGKGNAYGASLAGILPDVGPGGRALEEAAADLKVLWGEVNTDKGMTAPEIIEAAAAGGLDVLYVAGADPANDVPDRERWRAARARVPFVVVQDAFLSETAQSADVVLPTLVAPEKNGTVTSIEGRIRRLRAAAHGPGEARGDWTIFAALAVKLGKTIGYSSWEEIFDEMRGLIPALALDARLPMRHPPMDAGPDEGRYAIEEAKGYPYVLILGDVLFDRGALMTRSPTIADLAGEPWALIHPDDAATLGAVQDATVVISSRRGSIAVRARISSSIRPGEVFLPRGYDAAPANRLIDAREPVTYVQVRALVPATT